MKIYRVKNDVENFRWAIPKDESVWETSKLFFDGYAKNSPWEVLEFYVQNPLLKKGNTIHVGPGAIAYDSHSVEVLGEYLEMSGELLPILVEGETYYIHNITEVVNAADQDNLVWNIHEGVKTNITKFAFHKSRLTESSVFKIPETVRADLYVYSGLKDPEDEFYSAYNSLQLEGLEFELVADIN